MRMTVVARGRGFTCAGMHGMGQRRNFRCCRSVAAMHVMRGRRRLGGGSHLMLLMGRRARRLHRRRETL